ncbi:unnamed protein product [Adineta steineri]|uniref:B box-type domain-containing protein n=1 Tax=Adineta steineri TaxID=433720 RepID=A0A818IQZ5_9BILA|nr:unnamed protein product [Adineta steineri]CAF3523980.1 unnamed protein product [Adineta steineri]
MSNLRSTGHLPLKTTMTNKWKAQAPSSELLERQTRALEDSLNKLKIAMHPEKTKSTTETNGPIWDRGKSGPLSQYANHVLRDEPKRVFDANKPTKVRILTDEPPAPITRPSVVATLLSAKPTTNNKIIKCGQCEKDEAKMKCLECAECYCTGCFAHFHLRGALQRHRCVSLNESRPSTPQKKKAPVGADVIFKSLRVAQSKDDFLQRSAMGTEIYDYNDDDIIDEEGDGGELLNGNYDEKTSAASFQQALMQWRQQGDGGKKKSPKKNQSNKKKKSTHEAAVDTVQDSNGKLNQTAMPNIEFNSSKLTYGEKLLLKKYRRSNKNNQEFFNQRTTKGKTTPRDKPKKIGQIQANHSLDIPNLKDANIEIEPMYDDLSTMRTNESARTITAEENHQTDNFDQDDEEDEELLRLKEQERPKSRISIKPTPRPNSSAMRKNSVSSRPSSVALFQHPLPSLLATKPSDDLKAVIDPESRPSSAALKKPAKIDYRLPTIWNRNWKPEQSMSDGIDMKSIKVDQDAIVQFDLALNDLLDETKIEDASRADNSTDTSRPSTARLPPPPPSPSPAPISARSNKEKPIDSSTRTPRTSINVRSEKTKSIDSTTPTPTPQTSINVRSNKTTPTPTPQTSINVRSNRTTPTPTPQTSINVRSDKTKPIESPSPTPTPRTPISSRSNKTKSIDSTTPTPTPPEPFSARSDKIKSMDSPSATPRQNSLFNLSNSPRKMDSSSSMEGGFFTDVNLRKSITSPPTPTIVERSTSNRSARSSAEQRPAIPNLMTLRKTSIETLSRPPPKRSITIDDTHNQIDDYSRPGSSVSSASLPVSMVSSKPDLITRPSVDRYPKVNAQPAPAPPPQTKKKIRVEFPKKSAPPVIPPMVIEGKKVASAKNSARDSDEHFQQSLNSTRSKISSGLQKSQNILKNSSTSTMTSITRDENGLKDESLTITDASGMKNINRRSTNVDRKPTKSRAMEFTIKDGIKWQQGSSESVPHKSISSSAVRQSSKVNTARPSTPSNPTNSKLANQFSTYDVDDGRSSRAYQDVDDEESFNQLREELCSELGMTSPGWDASLSEHVLRNLRSAEVPFNEKDLQDNLAMLEVKLRESELVQRSQTDDIDATVQEEIRNL